MYHKAFDLHKLVTGDLKTLAEDVFESINTQSKWPPYDLVKTGDNQYVIRIAVAGFGEQDIELTMDGDKLTVQANSKQPEPTKEEVIYKGIANRGFSRTWNLKDKVEVKNATLVNGMLNVYLEHMANVSKAFKVPINAPKKPGLLNE